MEVEDEGIVVKGESTGKKMKGVVRSVSFGVRMFFSLNVSLLLIVLDFCM